MDGVSLDDLASAFGFNVKSDSDWSTLGKVTAVNSDGTISALLGGSSTPTTCATYCLASVGDIVYVIVSHGKARAIARQGGLDLPLSIANGGTGATTAAAARANLNVPSAIKVGNYWGIGTPDGLADDYIRTTVGGIIPYSSDQSTGISTVGTLRWPFRNTYTKYLNNYPLAASSITTISEVITTTNTAITFTSAAFHQYGRIAQVLIGFQCSSAITVGSAVAVGNIVSGKRPTITAWAGFQYTSGYIATGTGELLVRNVGASTLAAGTTIYAASTYILPV